MIEKFTREINRLAGTEKRFLLAVSGGLDSTCLVHLSEAAGLNFAIAHCNFQLRGTESDEEERFVKNLSLLYGKPFYTVHFDTRTYLQETGLSLQEGARKLRYDWFAEVMDHNQYDFLLTAHHLNDNIETFLYNFTKGTGIRGLAGIPIKNGRIIRPMLDFSRDDLKAFAAKNDYDYCIDSSNEKDDYNRNKLRHHVLPVLKEINPSIENTFRQTLNNLQQSAHYYHFFLNELKKEIVTDLQGIQYFNKTKLQHIPSPFTFLFENLHPFGFNAEVIMDMISKNNHTNGQFWESSQYKIWNEREYFVLEPLHVQLSNPLMLSNNPGSITYDDCHFEFEVLNHIPENYKSSPPNVALLDAEACSWPIVLRHWEEGDSIKPLGMDGKSQKLQDIFSNLKIDRFQKKKIVLIESNQKIAWIAGLRIHDDFKITSTTQKVLKIVSRSV
jgi:tRNA(Ile)-lysidine synthase